MDIDLQVALSLGEELFSTMRINQISISAFINELVGADSDDDDDEEELLHVIGVALAKEKPKRIELYVERIVHNYTSEEFQRNFRITHDAFKLLMGKVCPIILESVESSHVSVPLEKQVLSIIWLLSNQESYRSVGERFNMAKSTLSKVFFRVVIALNKLASSVIKWPSHDEMAETARCIEENTKLKNIIGAIDGMYIPVKAPAEHRESYTNRKMFIAVTLQAICNHKMEFMDCFAGFPRSAHDSRVFRNSVVYRDIMANPILYFPNGRKILGDKAYPHLDWCLVPYTDRGNLTDIDKNFNTVHASARQVIERSFALLFGRFRRLKYLEMNRFEWVPHTILAACVLHNICLQNWDPSISTYMDEGLPVAERNATQNFPSTENQTPQDRVTRTEEIRRNEEQRRNTARELWTHRRRRQTE